MPNPITYNGGTPVSGNLNRNGLAIGVNSVDFGSSPGGKTWYTGIEPEGYIIYSNTYSQGTTTQGNGKPTAWGTADTSDAGLLSLINYLPAREGLSKFPDLSSAISWLEGTGNYIIVNRNYSNIVTDNLKLLIDASFTASYPIAGTTWYDMSTNSINGSLVNGPVYSNGIIRTDGSNDYIEFSGLTAPSSGYYSVQMLCRWRRTTSGMFLGWTSYDIWTSGGNLGFNTGAGDIYGISRASVNSLGLIGTGAQNWKFYTFIFGTQVQNNEMWINNSKQVIGQVSNTTNLTSNRSGAFTSGIMRLSGWANSTSYCNDIDFVSVKIYDAKLTEEQILQNYFGSSIITDGLSLMYDPSNLISYQIGNTTVYNMLSSINGTLNNGVSYSSAYSGIWDFDGTDDWIQIPTYTFGNGNWSVSAWVNADDSSNYNIISNSSGGPVSNAFGLQTGKIFYRNYDGNWQNRIGNTTLSNGTWYMLTWVNYAGASASLGTMQMYVNGVLDSSLFNSYTTNGGPCDAIGRNWFSFYNGRIGTVQFYTKSLSQNEITQNFNAQRNRFGV